MKYFCILLSLVFACSMVSNSIAEGVPQVVINSSASAIPDSVVQSIVDSHPNAELITITGWHEAAPEESVMPRGTDWVDVTTTTTETNASLSTHFVISVARGASTTLSAKFSKTKSSSVSLNFSNGVSGIIPPTPLTLGRSRTVTAEISITRVFNGPSETSEYNSRSFYVRFYGDKGTWTGTAVNSVNPAARIPCSGVWMMPTSYAEYSVDSIVE